MDQRKKELELAAKELESDYSDQKVARYTAMEEAFKDDGGYYYEKEYDVMIRKFGFSDEERKKPLSDFFGRTADQDRIYKASSFKAGHPASR